MTKEGTQRTGHLRRAGLWVPPLVPFSDMRLNDERMKTVSKKLIGARRAGVLLLGVAGLVLGVVSSRAYSPGQFTALRTQLHADIAATAPLPDPTRTDRARLLALQRGSNVLTKISYTDGQTLRLLNSILGRQPAYLPALVTIRSNLLTGFNAEQEFVAGLLLELPESAAAALVKTQFEKFAPTGTRLNAATNVARFAGLYDGSKRRLDDLLIRANQASLIPFPTELLTDSVSARINGISFRTTYYGPNTENVFIATSTGTNLSLTLGALVNSGTNGARGILFSIPDAPLGAFRHVIPGPTVFTNRTGVYLPGGESSAAATNGAVFLNTTATEVYGTFSCSGPGFNITDGRFRITLSSQP